MYLFLAIVVIIIIILVWGRIGNQRAHDIRIKSNREDLLGSIPKKIQKKNIDEVDDRDIEKIKSSLKESGFTKNGIVSIINAINQAREGELRRFRNMFGDIEKVFRGSNKSVEKNGKVISQKTIKFESGLRYTNAEDLVKNFVFISERDMKNMIEKQFHKIVDTKIIWIGNKNGESFAHIGIVPRGELKKLNNIQMEEKGEKIIDYKDLCYELRTSIAYQDKFMKKQTPMRSGKKVRVDISMGRDEEFGEIFETFILDDS